jgi:large subunit ribosomal protein L30
MKLENFLNKNITVTQVKSESKLTAKLKGSLIGLGLRGIGSSSELMATNAVIGMVRKVNHVVKIAANS